MKYEHDTERWLRSQASLYRACHNRGLAEKFVLCADDVKALRAHVAELESAQTRPSGVGHQLEELKEAMRPVARWWYCDKAELTARRNVICANDAAKLDALAALVGEE